MPKAGLSSEVRVEHVRPHCCGLGAAKTFAARGLSGTKTLVIDAGVRFIEGSFLDGNLYDFRKRQDLYRESAGTWLESPTQEGRSDVQR